MRTLLYTFIALAIYFVHGHAVRTFRSGLFDFGIRRKTNGINATEKQFPYAISLQHLSPTEQALDTRGHRCGGALITLRHALTSASCLHETVYGEIHPSVIKPNEYRVFAGSILLTNDKASTTQPTPDTVRMITNFTIHPNYIGSPIFINDIGVITLATPFAAATVRPLSLPAADFHPADFTSCQAAGWGAPQYEKTASTTLWFSEKYIYNQKLCSTIYSLVNGMNKNGNPWNVQPSMVCAASLDIPSSSCVHDDGNALVCGGTLTGILVAHDGCSSLSHPELYTRVSSYTSWIRSVSASPALFTPAVFVTALFFITQIIFDLEL